MPPCCLSEISFALRSIMRICEQNEIGCELSEGTVLGSVKFESLFPWEIDGDIHWRSKDHQKLRNATHLFKSNGLTLKEEFTTAAKLQDCQNWTHFENCGFFRLFSKNFGQFGYELYGATSLAQDYLNERGINRPTKTLLDGQWVNTIPNPALYSRNLYGDDIFQHSEHWRSQGFSNGWISYSSGSFLKCPRPNFHGCLDQFKPTGNLQFRDL